ncbi:MAG TPA: (Fe-S)-binding protein [Ruminococcaceae bacterium]|nr:(Fe-S)-binding protein [Oscillospiraceae bacterium]
MSDKKITAVIGGERYVPYNERTGNESIVYFTRDLSAEGLKKVYEKVNGEMKGKIAVKLHTGEQHGPNIIPHAWVEELFKSEPELKNAAIVETNTYYEGDRYTTEQHLETLKVNGWTFCPVDIMDSEGTVKLPINGGKWMKEMCHGATMTSYDSMLTLTHFKGHTMGGFGGSNKNIGIGCADGRIGKKWIHTREGEDMWSIAEEELMERITESTKATIDFFGKNITYVNVMRNMSVSCDCEGLGAEPVVTPNVGILASTDILAIDQACVDLIYAMRKDENHALVERIETRHGHRQLSCMKEMGMGNNKYILIDTDNGDVRMEQKQAVENLKPFTV